MVNFIDAVFIASLYCKKKAKDDVTESEYVSKLMQIAILGEEVFGRIDAFHRWLLLPAYGLQGQMPVKLLHTIQGADSVAEELTHIAYGDFS
ncbi:MbcA/ParS/Xre antitoxin family protein [Hymenobacter glacieicola]|uniref:Antitoxin Xre/MbcA/ParS-like toxin-binding domain-containing protein n=1 Tax=Hymenobacter glacieicola TaxID=1562124 RepID=A0ABQ1X569_9BACT|nr:MbcA/ParS/Xre antitoxin family protein [Hymenobacter glacieicola]GGG60539.1 hypothetical protein GCM10011378_40710 [Hymenobacter glacieicola]